MPKPTDVQLEIEYTLHGIPCLIGVTHYYHQDPDYYTWDSDWDYYGFTEMDWIILDRKGYTAPWLERKVTNEDKKLIETAIVEYMSHSDPC